MVGLRAAVPGTNSLAQRQAEEETICPHRLVHLVEIVELIKVEFPASWGLCRGRFVPPSGVYIVLELFKKIHIDSGEDSYLVKTASIPSAN